MPHTLCPYAKDVEEDYTDPLDQCAGCEEDGSECSERFILDAGAS